MWALVINFVIIPLLFIGYLLTIASSIPDEIKVGFCVAALCAGMPFAPLLARLAKADVSIATTLLVVLSAGTIIALPLGLPLAIDAVDAQLKNLGLGCRVATAAFYSPTGRSGVRLQELVARPDAATGAVGRPGFNPRPPFNLNFSLVAYWDLFKQEVGHRELHRGPCRPIHRPRLWGHLRSLPVFESKTLESGMRPRRPLRYATSARMSLMMIYPFAADPLVTVSITILNTIGITTVLPFVLMWEVRCLTRGRGATSRDAAIGRWGEQPPGRAAAAAAATRPRRLPKPRGSSTATRPR